MIGREKTIPLPQFTTYLGDLVKDLAGRPLDISTSKTRLQNLVSKDIVGKYEATITYCCYMARLAYENTPRKVMKAYSLLNYSPLTFNLGLSYLTWGVSKDTNLEQKPSEKTPYGYLMYDSKEDNCLSINVFDYTQPGSSAIFPGEKIMVVSFRGTLSVQATFKDLNMTASSLFNIYKGADATPEFANELREMEGKPKQITAPFGAHTGFVNGLIDLYPKIIANIRSLLSEHKNVSRIFVTGHSLGAAYSHLFGLGLGNLLKRKKESQALAHNPFNDLTTLPSVHVISFGAPKTFTDYSRNVFNKLLTEGHLTLDRITVRPRHLIDPLFTFSDPIPFIPNHLDHPGFMILKTEMSTQRKTGRTKHMRKLRSELSGIEADDSSFIPGALKMKNYNALPDYQEYLKFFLDCVPGNVPLMISNKGIVASHVTGITQKEYKSMITTALGGTVRSKKGFFGSENVGVTKVFNIVSGIFEVDRSAVEASFVAADAAAAKAAKAVEGTAKLPVAAAAAEEEGPRGEEDPDATKEGGGVDTDLYKSLTVKMQPNQVVYSCSVVTSLVPSFGCHLGYMGVGFLGAALNTGSGTWTGSRDYGQEAALFWTNGRWTYVPDNKQGILGKSITQGITNVRTKVHGFRNTLHDTIGKVATQVPMISGLKNMGGPPPPANYSLYAPENVEAAEAASMKYNAAISRVNKNNFKKTFLKTLVNTRKKRAVGGKRFRKTRRIHNRK